jgi:hypothetical protein
MQISPHFLVCVAFAIACPIGAGCSSDGIDETSGIGGESSVTSGFDPEPPFTDGDGSSGTPMLPSDVLLSHYGDAEDQTTNAMAVNDFGEIALVGTARGTIDFGNIPWEGTTTDTDVVVAKISKEGQALWSRRYGDSCDQAGGAVAHTPSGNVLIAGNFCGKMDFGTTTVETKGAERDAFVAVIDALGEDVYSRSFGGKGAQIARAAAVDADGNAVIVGSFDQAFDDGTGEAVSAGLKDIFVLKLDPKGKLLWSERFGGPGADAPGAVAVDSAGNIVLGGKFEDSIDFGGGPLTASPGLPSSFLVQLNPSGKHLWSQSFAGVDAVVNGLAIGPKGAIAVAGSFAGTIDLGDGVLTSAGSNDAFVALLDSAGNIGWGRAFGGVKAEHGTGVAFGVGGSLALTGTAQDAVDFGDYGIAPKGPGMVYVVRFDAAGSIATGWGLGSSGMVESVGVALSSTLGMTVAGSFKAPISTEFGAVVPTGGWDMFLIREP